MEYMKACPGSKFDEIETAFRANEFNFYIYALVGFDQVSLSMFLH